MSYEQHANADNQQADETDQLDYISFSMSRAVLAYTLWLFLGQLGVHRFYLNYSSMLGSVQMVLGLFGWGIFLAFGSFFLLVPLWLWLLFDLFWIATRLGKLEKREFIRIGVKAKKKK